MTSKTAISLFARRLRFLSASDEAAFFHWLKRLKDFASARGEGDTIVIEVTQDQLDDDQLRELIALFFRYRIDMRQLSTFENSANKTWLRAKRAYWHQAMYDVVPAE